MSSPYHSSSPGKSSWQGGKGWNASGSRNAAGSWRQQAWGKNGRSSASGLAHGEFDAESGTALESPPKVTVFATYSYVSSSPSVLDVVSPAWSARTIPVSTDTRCHLDLSLERGLAKLQEDDGSFELSEAFVAVIGLAEAGPILQHAAHPEARLLGALMALKTVQVYKGKDLSPRLRKIYVAAESFACQHLGLPSSNALWEGIENSINSDQTPTEFDLSAEVSDILRHCFQPTGRWSFFELWEKLLPCETVDILRDAGGFLCPRFFLVDLASAPRSPYDIDKSFALLRHGPRIYVGQPPESQDGCHDAMRQGRQLEASLVTFPCLEEDHVICELRLGQTRAFYSAAPDAVLSESSSSKATEGPLEASSDTAYAAAGYSLADCFPVPSKKHEQCRLWQHDHNSIPHHDFVELKKTTHLHGRPGQFKLLKYWLQAALMRCGNVVIATTEGSDDGDVATQLRSHSLSDLESKIQSEQVWVTLAAMLQYVSKETASSEGRWTLRLQKASGIGAPVKLILQQGWTGCDVSEAAMGNIEERVSNMFC